MNNFTFPAVVTNVVDGDTMDVIIDIGFKLTTKQRIRLLGIDTPERGEPGYVEAGDYLRQYLGKAMFIKTEKADSFGRYLGIFYDPDTGVSINDIMLELGFAKPWER